MHHAQSAPCLVVSCARKVVGVSDRVQFHLTCSQMTENSLRTVMDNWVDR